MAQGYALGPVCHASLQQAAVQACANSFGVTSAGQQSCTGWRVNPDTTITLFLETSASPKKEYPLTLHPCEYPTFTDTYLPLIVSAVPILLLVVISKKIISLFKTEGVSP